MIMRRSVRLAFAAAVTSVLFLGACGSDESSGSSAATTVVSSVDTIAVDIDADAASPGTETVPLNATVALHITSGVEHEFHLHGYDLEEEGTDVTITFVADEAGTFEVEVHGEERVIFNLVVEG
jgi:hypothetical protein